MKFIKLVFLFLLFMMQASADVCYEGTRTFSGHGKVDLNWLVQFLPYNPVIIEVGAYTGNETLYAIKVWPQYQRLIAFEPNPFAFDLLVGRTAQIGEARIELVPVAISNYSGTATFYLARPDQESSLLAPREALREGSIRVPCITLDEWCAEHGVDAVDILRLEVEGLELQVLKASSQILKKTKILIVQSFFRPYRAGTTDYFHLKSFLTEAHFVPLAHWYERGERGLAVYISQELFDAYFVRSLGLGSGGLAYP